MILRVLTMSPACYNSSNVACDVLVLTPPEVAIRSTCPDLLNKASTSSTSYHQCPTCLELFPQSEIEVHADACAEAWVDPIGDLDEVDDTPPNEVEPIEDATGTLREPLDINLEFLRNEVSNLRRLCQCELTNRVSIRRRLIFQDYMDTRKKKWFKPKAMLKVTYVGEPAVDDGGPKREFFTGNFSKLRMAYKCCGSNFSLVYNFSNQFDFCSPLCQIMVIAFRQRKTKIEMV